MFGLDAVKAEVLMSKPWYWRGKLEVVVGERVWERSRSHAL